MSQDNVTVPTAATAPANTFSLADRIVHLAGHMAGNLKYDFALQVYCILFGI